MSKSFVTRGAPQKREKSPRGTKKKKGKKKKGVFGVEGCELGL